MVKGAVATSHAGCLRPRSSYGERAEIPRAIRRSTSSRWRIRGSCRPLPRAASPRGDRLVGDLGEFEQVVDHLLLEDRRAERGERVRVACGSSRRAAAPGRGTDGSAPTGRAAPPRRSPRSCCLLADLGEHEAETDAALGDLAIVLARRLLGRALVLEGLAALRRARPSTCRQMLSNSCSTSRRRQLEAVHLVELVEQLALHLLAGRLGRTALWSCWRTASRSFSSDSRPRRLRRIRRRA